MHVTEEARNKIVNLKHDVMSFDGAILRPELCRWQGHVAMSKGGTCLVGYLARPCL